MYKTNKEIEVELRELDALLGEVEVGEFTSDYEAYEIYEKYFDEVKTFLLAYADMLAKTGKHYSIDESPKLREWVDAFEAVSSCYEPVLATTNFMIANILKQALGDVKASSPIINAASIIEVTKAPYSPYYNEFTGGNK